MKDRSNPTRLSNSPEYGNIIKQLSQTEIDTSRLEKNEQVIQASVAKLAQAKIGASSGTRRLAWAVVSFSVVFCLSVGAIVLDKVMKSPQKSQPVVKKTDSAQSIEIQEEELVLPQVKEIQKPPKTSGAASELAHLEKPEAIKSNIGPQLRLYKKAKQAAAQGQYKKALKMLYDLEQLDPQGPLHHEVQVSRAEYLFLYGQYEQAIKVVIPLLEQPALAGKKPQLLRLLGDLWVHLGQCEKAKEAYLRALGLGLSQDQAQAARQGLKKCSEP